MVSSSAYESCGYPLSHFARSGRGARHALTCPDTVWVLIFFFPIYDPRSSRPNDFSGRVPHELTTVLPMDSKRLPKLGPTSQ